MFQISIRWMWVIAAGACLSLTGCAGEPRPMTVLMPTYSFSDAAFETANETGSVRGDAVAAVEP